MLTINTIVLELVIGIKILNRVRWMYRTCIDLGENIP